MSRFGSRALPPCTLRTPMTSQLLQYAASPCAAPPPGTIVQPVASAAAAATGPTTAATRAEAINRRMAGGSPREDGPSIATPSQGTSRWHRLVPQTAYRAVHGL